jgi:hypothetical protein
VTGGEEAKEEGTTLEDGEADERGSANGEALVRGATTGASPHAQALPPTRRNAAAATTR